MFERNLVTTLLLCFSFSGYTTVLPSRNDIDKMLSTLSSDEQAKERGGIDWGILPGPFYSPELGIGIGAALIGLYRIDDNDIKSQDSSLTLSGFVSSTGAFGVNFNDYNFLFNDKLRIYFNGHMQNMPTYYWGQEYHAGRRKANKEKYTIKSVALHPQVLYEVLDNTYLGLSWNINLSKAASLRLGDDSKFERLDEGTSVKSSGIGATFVYDSRDFIPNAATGNTFKIDWLYYSPKIASDTRFYSINTLYNQFISLNENYILAYETNIKLSEGRVPWSQMYSLGSSQRMRGYYEGRFLDRNMFSTQVELRQKWDWRHGMVYWLGAGTMSRKIGNLGTEKWLPTVGLGYRFEFKPRMNIRFDLGFGKDSVGFYFQAGEAF